MKSGDKKAFRAGFKEGDRLSVQLLIVDKKPENKNFVVNDIARNKCQYYDG
jgi:hypothetical protein